MLNQQRISLEQEFKQKRAENLETCRADFCAKTDAALVRYKQGREALGTPKQRPTCCAGSACRCSAGSQPASWRQCIAWASTG
jgi:hypothetical protein